MTPATTGQQFKASQPAARHARDQACRLRPARGTRAARASGRGWFTQCRLSGVIRAARAWRGRALILLIRNVGVVSQLPFQTAAGAGAGGAADAGIDRRRGPPRGEQISRLRPGTRMDTFRWMLSSDAKDSPTVAGRPRAGAGTGEVFSPLTPPSHLESPTVALPVCMPAHSRNR